MSRVHTAVHSRLCVSAKGLHANGFGLSSKPVHEHRRSCLFRLAAPCVPWKLTCEPCMDAWLHLVHRLVHMPSLTLQQDLSDPGCVASVF
mgnify:CR=1 FL=1